MGLHKSINLQRIVVSGLHKVIKSKFQDGGRMGRIKCGTDCESHQNLEIIH